jgi:acyl-CoA synthetase (AMP-forming)/AMP-acid ligase II
LPSECRKRRKWVREGLSRKIKDESSFSRLPKIAPVPGFLGDELLTWLRERLAHYKCPRSISFEEQLPRTDTCKLYKQSLIEKYGSPARG